MTAYGVLSRGLFSGSLPTRRGDLRGHLPRFSAENLASNQQVIEALKNLAREKGITPTQLAVAWALAKANSIVHVVGAHTRSQMEECLQALQTQLSSEDLVRLEQGVPAIAGTRYDPQQ